LAAIRAITLDLDDTLWEMLPVIRRAEQALRDWLAEHYPRTMELFPAPKVMELRQAVMLEYPERVHDLTFLRHEVIYRMGVESGYPDIHVAAAFDVFDRHRNTLELFPDVRPALTSLRERFRLVALTNGNARLDLIGIDDLFDEFVSARTAGAAKPAVQIFEAGVEAGGSSAAETLHVGDHPELDVHGAREAGLQATWMNRIGATWPDHLAPPESICENLADLVRLLATRS
jgi:putative hydrolase of the HAD superfamily